MAVADHVYSGVDWKCPGCDTPNSNAAHFCAACGSPREGDAKAVGLKSEAAPPPPPPKPSGGIPTMVLVGIGAVILLIVGLVAANSLLKKDVSLEVTSRSWERTVQLEVYGEQSREGWCDELPSGAKETRRFSAERSTREVPDGETCADKKVDQGDGTFKVVQDCTPKTKKEAVMADKCAYTVLDWAPGRKLVAKGGNGTANWPDTSLIAPGTERAGARTETFTVNLKGEDGSHACEVDEALFTRMAEGTRWAGQVGGLTGNVDCSALTPAK